MKLLCRIQILWKHRNSWEEKYLIDKRHVVTVFSISRVNSSEVKQRGERSQRYHFSATYVMEAIFSGLY